MNDFNRAVIAAYARMPLWRRDQFDASLREFGAALERMAVLMSAHQAALTELEKRMDGAAE